MPTIEELQEEIKKLKAELSECNKRLHRSKAAPVIAKYPYNKARLSHSEYLRDAKVIKNKTGEIIKGFVFEADAISSIGEKYFLAFGKKPKETAATAPADFSDNEFTLLVMKITKNSSTGSFELVLDPVSNDPEVFEYVDPCPASCVKDFTSKFPLLPKYP